VNGSEQFHCTGEPRDAAWHLGWRFLSSHNFLFSFYNSISVRTNPITETTSSTLHNSKLLVTLANPWLPSNGIEQTGEILPGLAPASALSSWLRPSFNAATAQSYLLVLKPLSQCWYKSWKIWTQNYSRIEFMTWPALGLVRKVRSEPIQPHIPIRCAATRDAFLLSKEHQNLYLNFTIF
jgi:hypothetical protein